ncbi:MAG: DUF2752 domain-containing protein [Nitrospiraceae bacterium]|nr:DUF2752 domain-containing protein [Nitrospiraceae bacterium]
MKYPIYLYIGTALFLLLIFLFNPTESLIFPPCLFKKLTGFYCPGCGSLRAFHQILHGNLAAAFGFNPMAVLMIPFLAGYILYDGVMNKIFQQKILMPPIVIWTLLFIIILFGILRNIPIYPFILLAP